jgi:hypothetical protein
MSTFLFHFCSVRRTDICGPRRFSDSGAFLTSHLRRNSFETVVYCPIRIIKNVAAKNARKHAMTSKSLPNQRAPFSSAHALESKKERPISMTMRPGSKRDGLSSSSFKEPKSTVMVAGDGRFENMLSLKLSQALIQREAGVKDLKSDTKSHIRAQIDRVQARMTLMSHCDHMQAEAEMLLSKTHFK